MLSRMLSTRRTPVVDGPELHDAKERVLLLEQRAKIHDSGRIEVRRLVKDDDTSGQILHRRGV